MKRMWLALAGAVLVMALVVAYNVGRARAYGIPQTNTLAYSGTLLTFGQPDNSAHLIGLTLYLSSGTATTCVVPAVSIQATNGQFTVPLPESCVAIIHANPGLQAQVNIDGTAMPMQALTAVPYAVEADTASNAAPGSALSFASQVITDTSGGTTCAGLAGHIRYTGAHFQGCNGTTWVSLEGLNTSSCLAILNSGGSTGNGNYQLTSSAGGMFNAYCDMNTAGGGWTEVFQGTNLNYNSESIGYVANVSGPNSVIANSTSMMFAYINPNATSPTNSALTQPWTFPTPSPFISATPMAAAECGYTTITATRLADGTQTTQILRYGWANFGSSCDQGCSGNYGQICLKSNSTEGSVGGYSDFPQYTGFATNETADFCAGSNQTFTAMSCSGSFEFAIFVR